MPAIRLAPLVSIARCSATGLVKGEFAGLIASIMLRMAKPILALSLSATPSS